MLYQFRFFQLAWILYINISSDRFNDIMKLEIMHYVNIARRIKSAFRRSRLTDILLSSSFYHSTGWNPLALSNRRYSSISNSTMWDLENDRQEGGGGGVKIDLTFPCAIAEVELSVASNLSLHLHHLFFTKSTTSPRKCLFVNHRFLCKLHNDANTTFKDCSQKVVWSWIASTV